MTSGGGAFSAEEVAYLKTLPAVADATRNRIIYAAAFKVDCVMRYMQGESPVQLFREAGLDPSIIGYKRIECAIARWRRQMHVSVTAVKRGAVNVETADGRGFAGGGAVSAQQGAGAQGDIRDMLIAQQVRRIDELEHQVDELSNRIRRLAAPLTPSRGVAVGISARDDDGVIDVCDTDVCDTDVCDAADASDGTGA